MELEIERKRVSPSYDVIITDGYSSDKTRTVNALYDADKIDVTRDDYFSDSYIFDIPLDSTPHRVWQDIFENEWKLSEHLWDKKVSVINDKLRLRTSTDRMEEKLDWIMRVIKRTNKVIVDYDKEMKLQAEPKAEPSEQEAELTKKIENIIRQKLQPC